MQIGYYIAKKLSLSKQQSFTKTITVLAIAAVSLSVCVVILSFGILLGFKKEIREKVRGYTGDVSVTQYQLATGSESNLFLINKKRLATINKEPSIASAFPFMNKAGILKSDYTLEGIILKGLPANYDFSFYKKHLKRGTLPQYTDTIDSYDILLSEYTATIMGVDTGERINLYFIDNEDFFTRKHTVKNEKGEFYTDNDERAMFFGRGVLETVKKLGWKPDIIHCHGWLTALTPLYIKKLYQNDPHFADVKVIYSVYENGFNKNWDAKFYDKLKFDGFEEEDIHDLKDVDFFALTKKAVSVSDGVIQGSGRIDSNILKMIEESETPFLEYFSEDSCVKPINEFYDQIFEEIVV